MNEKLCHTIFIGHPVGGRKIQRIIKIFNLMISDIFKGISLLNFLYRRHLHQIQRSHNI